VSKITNDDVTQSAYGNSGRQRVKKYPVAVIVICSDEDSVSVTDQQQQHQAGDMCSCLAQSSEQYNNAELVQRLAQLMTTSEGDHQATDERCDESGVGQQPVADVRSTRAL